MLYRIIRTVFEIGLLTHNAVTMVAQCTHDAILNFLFISGLWRYDATTMVVQCAHDAM